MFVIVRFINMSKILILPIIMHIIQGIRMVVCKKEKTRRKKRKKKRTDKRREMDDCGPLRFVYMQEEHYRKLFLN